MREFELKNKAVAYFRANSEQYAERYSVPAQGDVLRQRHEAILDLVVRLGLPSRSRLLDLGCGPGLLSFDLARRGYRGFGLDSAPGMIQLAKTQACDQGLSGLWQYQVADVEKLPLQEESFDGAICAGVIDYLPTDDNLLREAHRVLKPRGVLILAVTNKYGYTVSLSSVADCIKRSPSLMRLASEVRQKVIGGKYGAMSFDFVPRKHRPAAIRKSLARHGFEMAADRYLQFTALPAPFCAMFSRFSATRNGQMEMLERTPLRVFGSCYLVAARRA